MDLDFVAQSTNSGKTIFIDHKQMIDFQALADTKGINVKHFPSHESVAFNMGKDSVKHKKKDLLVLIKVQHIWTTLFI